MKHFWVRLFCTVLLLFGWITTGAYAQAAKAQAHVAAAKAVAYQPGQDLTRAFEVACAVPKSPEAAEQPAVPRSNARRIPPRTQWYAEPAKVFDNLYYVGSTNNSVWAAVTSEGIILIDANEDYAVEAEVVDGLKKIGLDASQIKYVVITASHTSSYGGAKYLQDHYGAHVLISEADWNVIAKANVPPEVKPKKDMVVTDGMKLTLGDTTVTLYVTPGHTPGTVSMLIPLKDGNQRHLGAELGGRDAGAEEEGVRYFDSRAIATSTWAASARRFQEIAAKAGADVMLSSRGSHDKTPDKLNALKYRQAGQPHPFVNKDVFRRFTTLISECNEAQLAWINSKS